MLFFKNHKAVTLIYHRNQGDNFWVFFSPLVKSEQNWFTLVENRFEQTNPKKIRFFKITAGPQHTFIATFY
jgi:hypothetical protein